MNTNLPDLLRETVANHNSDRVLRAMGYSGSALSRAMVRLRAVLEDPKLGLECGQYDFRFAGREFVVALAKALGLESGPVAAWLDGIEVEIEEERQAFKPWLFVDTGFQRTSEPVFALAVTEGKRRLQLPKDSWRLPRSQLLAAAADCIRTHYRNCRGRLPLWGAIREYWLILSDAEQAVMDVSGEVIRVEPRKSIGRAFLTLR